MWEFSLEGFEKLWIDLKTHAFQSWYKTGAGISELIHWIMFAHKMYVEPHFDHMKNNQSQDLETSMKRLWNSENIYKPMEPFSERIILLRIQTLWKVTMWIANKSPEKKYTIAQEIDMVAKSIRFLLRNGRVRIRKDAERRICAPQALTNGRLERLWHDIYSECEKLSELEGEITEVNTTEILMYYIDQMIKKGICTHESWVSSSDFKDAFLHLFLEDRNGIHQTRILKFFAEIMTQLPTLAKDDVTLHTLLLGRKKD